MKQLDSFRHLYLHIYVYLWVSCVTITSCQLLPCPTKKIQWLMYLLSHGFRHIHTSHVSRVAEILWELILLYIWDKFGQILQTRMVLLLQTWWIMMANMFTHTNRFNRISSRKGNTRNLIISTSVCGCAEWARWLALVMGHWYCLLHLAMIPINQV